MPSKWCSASQSISMPRASQRRASRSVSWMICWSIAGSIDAGNRKLLNFTRERYHAFRPRAFCYHPVGCRMPAPRSPREATMRYRPFGRTGLSGSGVGFGCGPMAGDRYGAIEDDEAVRAIHRALDRGVNCVDTAPAYGGGHSEEVVARALEGRRKDVILVTKCGVKVPPLGQPGPLRDASRANIFREIEASLQRLRTDWVDVLLVHWPDAGT